MEPGTLSQYLRSSVRTATISGPLNGTDVKYLRQLINEGSLESLDLSDATFVKGGEAYFNVMSKTPTEVKRLAFNSHPVIHVYKESLEAYQNSDWAGYGTIVGDLDEILQMEALGVEETVADKPQVWKIIRDNHVIIIRDGEEWTVTGQKIR